MRILLTGYKGFIGSKLFEKLKENHFVIGYDLQDGDDIRDTFRLDKVFSDNNFDMVVHLAALAGVRRGEEFPEEYISTNITGTQNLVNLCKKYNVKKFLSYSSSSVLGGNHNENIGLTEKDEYNPKSLYAITKVAGEHIVKNSGLKYTIVRPFTVFGPNGRPDMVIYKWINQIKSNKPISFYGDGKTSRGYTYVYDLIDGTVKIIEDIGNMPEVFNLGGNEIVTLDSLYNIFKEYCGTSISFTVDHINLPKADVLYSFADTGQALKLLDFKSSKKFKDVIIEILNKELLIS